MNRSELRKWYKQIAVKISPGNTKTGAIPAVSLMPVLTCPSGVPCTQDCYDLRCCRLRPYVMRARLHNTNLLNTDPAKYFEDIRVYILYKQPEFFRFHIGGDIPSLSYFVRMKDLVVACPDTKFLCFTKNFGLFPHGKPVFMPDNLQVVLSMWPGLRKPNIRLPKAWMQDGTEKRIPDNVLECTGSCDKCGMCWQLGKLNRDVVFAKH